MKWPAAGPARLAAGSGSVLRGVATAGLALVACLSVAQAQEREPAYQRLLGALKQPYLSVGALLQTVGDFQIERSRAGHDGFSVPNFRISLAGELDHRFGYFLQTNFAASPAILDARLHFRPSGHTRLDVGQFKVPFSGEFLTGAADLDFVNRAEAVRALAPGRQIGFQGSADLGDRLTLRAGAFNGNPAGANANDNNALLAAVRLEARPWGAAGTGPSPRLVVGINGAHSRDSAATLPGLVAGFEGTRTLLGADARFTAGAWLLAGEVVFAHLAPRGGTVLEPVGHYLTAGYRVSPPVQLLFRWERFDPDGPASTRDALIGGLTLRPTSFTKMQVNYLVQTRDAAFDHHQLLVNFQFGF